MQKHTQEAPRMHPPSSKRQRLEDKDVTAQGTENTQLLTSIISSNKRMLLEFRDQLNKLKCVSSAKEYEVISAQWKDLIDSLENLQKLPTRLPCGSSGLGQLSSTSSAHYVMDLHSADDVPKATYVEDGRPPDLHGKSEGTEGNAPVIIADSDKLSSGTSNQQDHGIQTCSLPPQPPIHAPEIMLLDAVVEQGEDNACVHNAIDNELPQSPVQPQEIDMLDTNGCSEVQRVIEQEHDNTDSKIVGNENHENMKGVAEHEVIAEKSSNSIAAFCDVSCKDTQKNSPNGQSNNQDDRTSSVDELDDLWRDMSLAMECSKPIGVTNTVVPSDELICKESEEKCHHSFLLKDDVGIVCRVCGLIQQKIEKFVEIQWKKGKRSTRTYPSGYRNSCHLDVIADRSGVRLSNVEVVHDALSIHPRHSKQMKPHQLEGFNFLVRNLADEKNPGGCILAHAPGSGKTFMLICFIQGFLAKYPDARPLIVLPKGILATWRAEFLHWQVDEIPLHDFYSAKADNRAQQLEVLKLWEDSRSILLLGYQQFAMIISEHASDRDAAACQERLLKVPSLLILDEGHTPRNENTDLLTSLAKIQTPRKVVLSGTLFQNRVSEVFSILNLVRPKFLKMEQSRATVKRIMSQVDMSGKKARSMNVPDKYFYDLVEGSLQKDEDDKTRVMVIQNLRELTQSVLHYYKGEFLEELPGLLDFTVFLNPSPQQAGIIKNLLNLDKFKRRSTCHAISLHPCFKDLISRNESQERGGIISDEKMDSILHEIDVSDGVKAKFILNLSSLSDAAGEKLLVFSQYVRSLLFLERLVMKEKGWKQGVQSFMMHGKSSQDQREHAMRRFNDSPSAKIFFGSIKACGEGISLVGASRVVILDVHENPSVMRQAIGRAFRPGQTKMVYCYRLVTADSPEEGDHHTAFRKERISKMWFEWNEFCSNQDFELAAVDISGCEDKFLESAVLHGDVKSLYRR